MGKIEAERLPADPDAAERSKAEVRLSLARFDFTQSGTSRMLLASVGGAPAGASSPDSRTAVRAAVGGAPAGYALVVRIPKPDARVGFLFVEELYVLATYRRAGVARALLRHCESVAQEWGLHGIRLLVRPENEAARQLYQSAGFAETLTNFCEKILA